jgi:hypothetical protein
MGEASSRRELRRVDDDIATKTSPVLTQALRAMRSRGPGPSAIAKELHGLAPVDLGGDGQPAARQTVRHLRVVV